jgi:hypothetical protein
MLTLIQKTELEIYSKGKHGTGQTLQSGKTDYNNARTF